MNKSILKKLIESLTDEVIAEKQLEEAGVKPKDLKPGTEYTYTGGAVNFTAKFVGFDQNKDKLKPYTFEYKGKKLQLSAPEVSKFVEADLDEKTVISSTDGTEKTLTSDQKKKVQMAADGGDTVSIKKKGAPIAEADDAEYEYIIVDSKSDNKKVGGPYKTSRIAHGIADKKDSEYGAVRYIVQSVKKASVKESDTELNENDINPSQPSEINVAEAIDSAISSLSQTSESTENATYKRLAEKTLRILNTAKEAYSKLAEKMSLDEEKDTDKHVEQVKKHLGKKFKDKKDLEPVMAKYHKVAKKLSSVTKDPVKTADALWKHILKENKDI